MARKLILFPLSTLLLGPLLVACGAPTESSADTITPRENVLSRETLADGTVLELIGHKSDGNAGLLITTPIDRQLGPAFDELSAAEKYHALTGKEAPPELQPTPGITEEAPLPPTSAATVWDCHTDADFHACIYRTNTEWVHGVQTRGRYHAKFCAAQYTEFTIWWEDIWGHGTLANSFLSANCVQYDDNPYWKTNYMTTLSPKDPRSYASAAIWGTN